MEEGSSDEYKTACTALRQVANNNLQSYQLADKKASILIQANALMITVLVGSMVNYSLFHRLAFIPVAGQFLFSVVVILLSVRSTQPVALLKRHPDETKNLLHFNDYDRMEDEEYMADMNEMLEDSDATYRCLIQDVYFQAQLIAEKYRWLRRASNVFLAGLGINVLASIGIVLY